MPKKKVVKFSEEELAEKDIKVESVVKITITPITQEFGNGDLNILRDKINEIIRTI